ncbi:MAG: glycosyltransferase family 9 protein [Candidatus Aenigmarchaeota archaeon]|nr:glycosyltransferase family 9 protein [Candidatus Aenigmarchaeota archaeon]
MIEPKYDCKHFIGYKPCLPHKNHGVICNNCDRYEKIGKRILLINLEYSGDVLRTTSLLKPLKEKYPDCHITWIVNKGSEEFLSNNQFIDRLLVTGYETFVRMFVEDFDIIINLDKRPEATSIASIVKASEKYGFGMRPDGNVFAYNKASKYLLDMGLSDDIKRSNTKTQQQIIFEMADIAYKRQMPVLNITEDGKHFADEFLLNHKIQADEKIIGIHTGCGSLFPDRKWSAERFSELIEMVDNKIIIFTGPGEKEINEKLITKGNVFIADTSKSLHHLAALVSRCNLVLTGDTMAAHIAAALNIPVIVLFGPTNEHEIEIYGNGKKLSSPSSYAPCYKHTCEMHNGPRCIDQISAKNVFDKVNEVFR